VARRDRERRADRSSIGRRIVARMHHFGYDPAIAGEWTGSTGCPRPQGRCDATD
jgi:hypothetical protein